MSSFKCSTLVTALAATILATVASRSEAQTIIDVGAAPVCPYGYYDYAPYACAPYGYYGPEWFANGVFIGVGPWFHGPANFIGHVDSRFDIRRGYGGPIPNRGDNPDPSRHFDRIDNFQGSEMRDGRGEGGGRR